MTLRFLIPARQTPPFPPSHAQSYLASHPAEGAVLRRYLYIQADGAGSSILRVKSGCPKLTRTLAELQGSSHRRWSDDMRATSRGAHLTRHSTAEHQLRGRSTLRGPPPRPQHTRSRLSRATRAWRTTPLHDGLEICHGQDSTGLRCSELQQGHNPGFPSSPGFPLSQIRGKPNPRADQLARGPDWDMTPRGICNSTCPMSLVPALFSPLGRAPRATTLAGW